MEVVREVAGTQLAMTYIGRQHENVSQWVALRPIFEACAGDKGYGGGDVGRIYGVTKRQHISSLGQLWKKYRGKHGGGNRMRYPRSRSQGKSG